jgi:hypothetical protein
MRQMGDALLCAILWEKRYLKSWISGLKWCESLHKAQCLISRKYSFSSPNFMHPNTFAITAYLYAFSVWSHHKGRFGEVWYRQKWGTISTYRLETSCCSTTWDWEAKGGLFSLFANLLLLLLCDKPLFDHFELEHMECMATFILRTLVTWIRWTHKFDF